MYLSNELNELPDIGFDDGVGVEGISLGESPPACGAYVRGEVTRSRTAAGHITPDVRLLTGGRLLIADFGVNRGGVKRSTRSEALLRAWLRRFESDTSYRLRIVGYSDCVGNERANKTLRRRRARMVRRLLGRSARARVTAIGAAPRGAQVPGTDMRNAAGRALNRAVIIEFQRTLSFPPDTIRGRRPDVKKLVRRSIGLIKSPKGRAFLGKHPSRRLGCMLLRLLWPEGDDRFITAQSVLDYMNTSYRRSPSISNAKQWLQFHPGVSDERLLQRLQTIDRMIIEGRHKVNQLHAQHGRSVHVRVRQIRGWIAARQRNRKSIYHCYRG